MKSGFKFIASYSILSLALFGVSKLFFKQLTMEIFSYLLYYYILVLSITIILYPICSWILEKNHFSLKSKMFCSFLLCLIIINSIPFFYDNQRILLVDIVKGIFIDKSILGFNNVGIHLIAIISFTFCYLLYRKDSYWSVK